MPQERGPWEEYRPQPKPNESAAAGVPEESGPWMSYRRPLGEQALVFLKGAWSEINPWEQLKGIATAASDPVAAGKAVLDAQGNLAMRAKASFESGDYLEGLRHSLGYLTPLLGPRMDELGTEMAEGKTPAETLGKSVGFGLASAGPGIENVRIPAPFKPRNAVVADAMQAAQAEGIPVPAGQATSR